MAGLRAGKSSPIPVLLVLMLIGAFPAWPHSKSWGYYPSPRVKDAKFENPIWGKHPISRKAILIIINRTVKSERHEKHSITGRSTDDAGDFYTERKLAENELVDAVDQKLGGGYAFSPPVAEIAPGRLPFSE